MSQFLHQEFTLDHGDVVDVQLSGSESDVFLVDTLNFSAFQSGRSYRYHGGHFRQSPVRIAAPHAGHWHLVVRPTGGSVRASTRIIRR